MNQFLSAWKFTSNHLGYLVALALPVAFMEVSVAYLLLPIQDATQPEDLIEYINSNGSLFFLTAALATVIQMGFVGGIWVAFSSIENDGDISPLDAQITGNKKFFQLMGATINVCVASLIGFIFLILPGIYLMARLSLTFGYIVLEDKGVFESIGKSWESTDEHGGRLFSLTLSFVSLTLLISLVVGAVIEPGLVNLTFLSMAEYLLALPLAYIYFTLYKSLKNHKRIIVQIGF